MRPRPSGLAENYGPTVRSVMFDIAGQIRGALSGGATDTLVTKIMLGAFGCVPAFDQNFRTGSHFSSFGPAAFHALGQFYAANRDDIETNRVRTISFDTAKPTNRRYTRAKVIDMIYFIDGGG